MMHWMMMQATSSWESDRWVNGVHTACTASHVRRHGRARTLRLLSAHIRTLDNAIQQVRLHGPINNPHRTHSIDAGCSYTS